METAKGNVNLVNEQVAFIIDMITAIEAKWDSKRIAIQDPTILNDLSTEFRHEYGVKCIIHKNEVEIEYE